MHIACCKCLNVYVNSRGNGPQRINVDEIELTAHERADEFFRESIAKIAELEGITKEQPGLVEIRNVGSWVIHRCLNCSMYTHAIHKEHGAALVLINNDIVTSPGEIHKLKSSIDYSPVFRLVIDHSTLDDPDNLQPTKFSVSQLPNNVQVALGGLQQQLEEAVHQRAAEIEEKIRTFTAEQYELLEQFRERAHNEHRLLTKLICNGQEAKKLSNHIDATPTPTDSFKKNVSTSIVNATNAKSQVTPKDVKTNPGSKMSRAYVKHSSNVLVNGIDKRDSLRVRISEPRSVDTEALFHLEGVEDTSTLDLPQSSEDGSDTDDSGQDEGIHMSRGQRGGHPTLARSLPVNVPSFPSFIRRTIQDQDDDQLSRDPLDPHNIRASIKALAKSVHGDTVFGDLPRPRFSTQI